MRRHSRRTCRRTGPRTPRHRGRPRPPSHDRPASRSLLWTQALSFPSDVTNLLPGLGASSADQGDEAKPTQCCCSAEVALEGPDDAEIGVTFNPETAHGESRGPGHAQGPTCHANLQYGPSQPARGIAAGG